MLTLICGMPRAGKTTYSRQFDNVIHLDGLSYHAVKRKVAEALGDIVVDGVYAHPQNRKSLIAAYNGKGKRCIWLDTPLEVRRTRPMWHPCPEMEFEPPTLDEGWDEIIRIRNDERDHIKRET